MPPPSSHPSLFLRLLKQPFFVTQLQPNAAIPVPFIEALSSDNSGRFLSITRTAEEISIVGEVTSIFPVDVDDSKWRCINIAGPMEFGLMTTRRESYILIWQFLQVWQASWVASPLRLKMQKFRSLLFLRGKWKPFLARFNVEPGSLGIQITYWCPWIRLTRLSACWRMMGGPLSRLEKPQSITSG